MIDPFPTTKYGKLMKLINKKDIKLGLGLLALMILEDATAGTIARHTDINMIIISVSVCAIFVFIGIIISKNRL